MRGLNQVVGLYILILKAVLNWVPLFDIELIARGLKSKEVWYILSVIFKGKIATPYIFLAPPGGKNFEVLDLGSVCRLDR